MTRLISSILLLAVMTLGAPAAAVAQSVGHGHHGGHIAHGIFKHFALHGHHRSGHHRFGHHRSGHHRFGHHRFGGHRRHHGHDLHSSRHRHGAGHSGSARHGRHDRGHAGAGHGDCHRVYKRSHHRGQPARIGGVQCYDSHGRPYIVSGSRFVDSYY